MWRGAWALCFGSQHTLYAHHIACGMYEREGIEETAHGGGREGTRMWALSPPPQDLVAANAASDYFSYIAPVPHMATVS